jgi:hypothetical protein
MIEIGSMTQPQSMKSQSNHKDLKDLKEIISDSLCPGGPAAPSTNPGTIVTFGDNMSIRKATLIR